MPSVTFTENLRRHLDVPTVAVRGGSVREVLDAVFEANPALRGYVLDDQARLRKHVQIFVDGQMIGDRTGLTDEVGDESDLYVMQALSGG